MTSLGESARVTVFLADYAAADVAAKVNVIGAGWQITGVDQTTGLTAPQCVVVMIDVPPDFYGEDYAITLTLRDEHGDPIALPGPAGTAEAMRITHTVRAEEPRFAPGIHVPRRQLWAHNQIVLNLANGLPLPMGRMYSWTVDIDTTSDPHWVAPFCVPGLPPGPIFGGPSNPAAIPELGPPE